MAVNEVISQEAVFLGISILAGAGLACLYDILRIFRRVAAHGNLWIGLEDFIYWVICTGVVFVMLYRENDGMARGYAFGGVMLGMLLYHLLLSRFLVGIHVFVIQKILGAVKKIAGWLFGPFVRIGKKAARFLTKQLQKCGKAVKMGLRKK